MPRVRVTPEIALAYEEIGVPDGEPVLLIMGLGASLAYWEDDFCRRIAEPGYRVIRFDNRDVGLSTIVDWETVPNILDMLLIAKAGGRQPRVPYTLSDMAMDTVRLMDGLHIDRAHLVGVSLGGMIAQTLAFEHPTRVRTLTSIMSTTGDRSLPAATPEAVGALLRPRSSHRAMAIEQTVETWRVISGGRVPFEEDRIRRMTHLAFDRGVTAEGVGRQFAAILADGSRRERLRAVVAPTMIIHGEADPLVPPDCGRDTAHHIPNALFELIPDMGHTLPRIAWDAIVRATHSNFLRDGDDFTTTLRH